MVAARAGHRELFAFDSASAAAQRFADCLAPATFGSDITNGYRARRLPSGNYEVRDLEIFSVTSRTNPHTGKVDVFDKAWLEGAAARFNEMYRGGQGHMPPAHLGHHNDHQQTEPKSAGYVKALDVRSSEQGVPTLYATVTEIPPAAFEEMVAFRYPYRSIEVNDPSKTEVSSLAFLSTTVPYFKFRMFRPVLESGAVGRFGEPGGGRFCFFDREPEGEFTGATGALYVVGRFERGNAAFSKPTAFKIRFASGGGYSRMPRDLNDDDLQSLYADDEDDDSGWQQDMDDEDRAMLADEAGTDQEDAQMTKLAQIIAGAVGPAVQQAVQQGMQGIAAQLAPPASSPSASTPPPVVSAEPKVAGVQFSDADKAAMPPWAKAIVASCEALQTEAAESRAFREQYHIDQATYAAEKVCQQVFNEEYAKLQKEGRPEQVLKSAETGFYGNDATRTPGTIATIFNEVPLATQDGRLNAAGFENATKQFFSSFRAGLGNTSFSGNPPPPPANGNAATTAASTNGNGHSPVVSASTRFNETAVLGAHLARHAAKFAEGNPQAEEWRKIAQKFHDAYDEVPLSVRPMYGDGSRASFVAMKLVETEKQLNAGR